MPRAHKRGPSPSVRNTFSLRLRNLRRAHGKQIGRRLSQPAFAALLGINGDRYGSYERADRSPPLEVLAALRRVTGVDLDELIG
jgi:transcriptional regulator with XRE-family HTH domain